MRARSRFRQGPVPFAERVRRTNEARFFKAMDWWLYRAFSDERMIENASLIVWTKGQMRGVRATLKRLGLGKEQC